MSVAPNTGAQPHGDRLYSLLRTLGRHLDDLETTRIMAANRIGADERRYGSSLPGLTAALDRVAAVEHLAELDLIRAWRTHPLAPWAKSIAGLGEKSIARLIAEIGQPSVAQLGEWRKLPTGDREWVITGSRERSISELRSYCGVGDPSRKRVKGMLQEELMRLGKPRAKKQVWLITDALIKRQCSVCRFAGAHAKTTEAPRDWNPSGCSCEADGLVYRAVYNRRRAVTADRVHADPCVRCGPSGKPAQTGSPWSDKHRHEDGKRIVGKTLLKDLWIADRQLSPATQRADARGGPE